MIYLGNFSYNDKLDSTDNYCLMPCIVEADSTDHALKLFSEHLIEVTKTSDLLFLTPLLSWEKFLPLL